MIRQPVLLLPTIFVALVILTLSVYQASAIEYEFSPLVSKASSPMPSSVPNYDLPDPGVINPDNPLWVFKAGSDRIILFAQIDESQKAHKLLDFADERLVLAEKLIKDGNPELGVSVLTKAEKYLEQAALVWKENGRKDTSFETRLFNSAHAHKAKIDEIINNCPDEARPIVVTSSNYSRQLLGEAK